MPNSSSFSIEQAIDRHPPTTTSDTSITSTLLKMQEAESSYILVTESDNRFISLITERDLVNVINQKEILKAELSAVMPSYVITTNIDEIPDLLTARMLLRQHKIRHIPLINHQKYIDGVITYDNLSRLLNPVDLLRLRYVAEVMMPQVVWASPHTSLVELRNLMVDHRVSCIVIGEATPMLGCIRPLGVVTEPEIIRQFFQEEGFEHKCAHDLLHKSFKYIRSTDSLWYAHEMMKASDTRRLVVVDSNGFLAGVITQSSLFQSVEHDEARLTLKTLTNIIDEHTADLNQANQKLQRKAQERKRAKAALQQQIARERLVHRITQDIRQSLELDTILTTAVGEVSDFFKTDRTCIYRIIDEDKKIGGIVTESVSDESNIPIGGQVLEDVIDQLDWTFYISGRLHSVPDLKASDLSSYKARFLGYVGIRSVVIAPILVTNKLWGLLLVTQQTPRRWERSEINLLNQITAQIGLAIQQAILYSQLEVANQKLLNQANTDELTQLSNRRRFENCLDQEWRRLRRENQPLSIILCDVDHFKLYNDTYGHQAGDDCLKAVAQSIKQAIKRPADEAARYGGEEFVLILPNTPLAGAKHVAEQVRKNIQALHLPHKSSKTSDCVTISLGIACCIPNPSSSMDELIQKADMALYQAKEGGRNCWVADSSLSPSNLSYETSVVTT